MIKILISLLSVFTTLVTQKIRKKESIYCIDKICTVWESRNALLSHCPLPPPSPLLPHHCCCGCGLAYCVGGGVVAGSMHHVGVMMGSSQVGVMVGLVCYAGMASWWGLHVASWCCGRSCMPCWGSVMVCWHCSRSCMLWWHGIRAGLVCHDRVVVVDLHVVRVKVAAIAWCVARWRWWQWQGFARLEALRGEAWVHFLHVLERWAGLRTKVQWQVRKRWALQH